jgi:TRAP-type C4-dicarboxylate transport system substrate-binding protein
MDPKAGLVSKCLATIAFIAGAFASPSAFAQKVTWNLAYISAPKTVYQEVINELPARIAKTTGGRVEVHTTPSLVPPTEHLAAIKDGRLEAALMTNAYYSGEVPLLNIGGLPGVFQTIDEYRIANEKVLTPRFSKLLDERYNAVSLLTGVWSGQMIWSREPIRALSEYSGKKVRAHNSETAQLLASFGAKPIAMPLGDFIPAVQRGVVDAGITGSMTGFGLGMQQVAKYICDWRIGYVSAWTLVINKDAWAKISDADRRAIQADMKQLEADIFKRVAAETEQGIKLAVEQGAVLVTPVPAELAKAQDRKILGELDEKWTASNKKQGIQDSAEVLKAVRASLGR